MAVDVTDPDDESTKPKKDDDKDILEEAKKRFDRCMAEDSENRANQREDTEFVYKVGAQWSDEARKFRKLAGDPCQEYNQLKQFVHQIVNDMRQQRPGIRIHPASGEASEDTAEVMEGMIRAIENASSAEAAYDGGYLHTVVGGRGYWRVVSEYESGFNQRLKILRIPDPMSVWMDLDFLEPDGSDINFCFVTEKMTKEDFKAKYPDQDPSSWESDVTCKAWFDADDIVIADYYRRVCTPRPWVVLSNGSEGYKDQLPKKLPPGITIKDTRDAEEYSVEWYKIAGGSAVLEQVEWPGTIIPVVCSMGDEIMIDGKRTFQGAIRQARGVQQSFNAGMTAQYVKMALAPRAPYIADVRSIAGYETLWEKANEKNLSVLPYNATTPEGEALPAPTRTQGAQIEPGWMNWTQQMTGLFRSTTGLYQNSLGMQGNETSGLAINARARQGDNATFHFVDNLSRAIALTGKIIVDVMPAFYDTERMVQTIGADGMRQIERINTVVQGQPDPLTGAMQAIMDNNIGQGDYAVTVDSGPSYETRRQESSDSMMQFIKAYPQAAPIVGDLIAKEMDWPGAQPIADRLKLMLPPQIQQMEQAKDQGQDPQVVALTQHLQQVTQQGQEAVQHLQGTITQLQQQLQALKTDRSIEVQDSTMKHDTAQADVLVKFITAITPLLVAQGPSAIPESQAAIVAGDQTLFQGVKPPVPLIDLQQMQPPPQPAQPQQPQGM